MIFLKCKLEILHRGKVSKGLCKSSTEVIWFLSKGKSCKANCWPARGTVLMHGDAQAAALLCPCRNFTRKILLFFAALQFGPTRCVTFWLSHNAKKVGFVSRAKLSCGKFFYRSMENCNFSAEFLCCSIAFLATIFLLKFCKVRHYFIKCCRFFLQEICMASCLTQKFFEAAVCPFVLTVCESEMKHRCHQLS